MAWQLKKLSLPSTAKQALRDNLEGRATPFSLSIRGTKIGMHNWTHGIEEKSNRYLSPVNAIKALQTKLADYQDGNRPTGVCDVVIFMLSSNNDVDFIAQLENVAVLMPDPVFKQALDYAKAHKDLAQSKMVKTLPLSHPAFGKNADITPQSGRVLNGIMRNAQALNESSPDPFAVIEQLKAKKAEKQAEQQKQVKKLLASAVNIQAFLARGLLDEVALSLMDNLINGGHSFTALLCFIGEDLSPLRGMLHEPI
ncbi:hypothetical protein ACFGY8_04385 [Pasteurella multocida]